jgi:chromosome segregation ATPase
MKKLSLNKASQEAGIAKKTLLSAIASGKMTAPKNTKGHYEIDPAELFRAFPKTSSETVSETETHLLKNDMETSVLQAKLEVMEQRFTDAEKTIEDLRRRLDDEASERRETQRMLTHMTTPKEEPQKGFFKRLFS